MSTPVTVDEHGWREHPDFSTFSDQRLQLSQELIDENIDWAKKSGDPVLETYYEQEMRLLQAERGRRSRNGHNGNDSHEWPQPKQIQAALHPVPAFDPDTLLPAALRTWVMDEADRMPCPPDLVAAPAIVALGSTIGARCAIKPKFRDDWLVTPNLWGGVVAPPAAKKTPAMSGAFKPLDRLIARAIEAHKTELETFEAKNTVFEAEKDAIEASIKSSAR